MEWLNILGPILGFAALVFFIWRMKRNKVESPAAMGFITIAALVLLVWLEGWGSHVLLFLLLALAGLELIPAWVFYVAGIGIFGFICWYLFNLLGSSIIELAQEIAATRERIASMENLLIDKLDDIASRLPRTDSPETD